MISKIDLAPNIDISTDAEIIRLSRDASDENPIVYMDPTDSMSHQVEWENTLINSHINVLRKNLYGYGDSENTDEERKYQVLLAQLTLANKSLESLHQKMDSDHEAFQKEISSLREELADKETVIKSKADIIKKVSEESEIIRTQLDSKVEELKKDLNHYFPHKQAFKAGSISSLFFLFSFLVRVFTGVVIVTPFWNILGLGVSFGVLILSYFLYLDWKRLD